jgi:hypothetical protein
VSAVSKRHAVVKGIVYNLLGMIYNPVTQRSPDFNYLLFYAISLEIVHGGQQTKVILWKASVDLDVRLLPGGNPASFLV